MKQTMETGVEHFSTLGEELLFDPDLFINELMCAEDFEEIEFKNDHIKADLWPISNLWPISEVIMCENCTQNFEDLNTIRAHLLSNPSCFYLLIKQYWYKNPDEKQLCGICDKEMLNEFMLKQHCFECEDCRKAYIDLYVAIKYDVKSELMSSKVDTKDNFLTPNNNYIHFNNFFGCTPKHISETSNRELHTSALTGVKDNFQDENSNLSKQIKRTPSMTSEIVDKVKNIPDLTLTHDCSQGVNIEQPFAKIQRSSTERDFKPCITSTPDITVRHSDSNVTNQLPHFKYQKNTGMSQYDDDDKPVESVRNKGKHLAKREAGQSQVKSLPTISCVCCDLNFISEEEKRNHLIVSSSCQLYLKNSFLDGQYLNDTPICDNYTLNKNMCPFCLFTVDDGQVIHHIINVIKCRNKLEEAISNFHMQSRNLPTSHYEPQQPVPFTCNICNRKYKTIRHLKGHKTLKHSDNDYSKSIHVKKTSHLFKFLPGSDQTKQLHVNDLDITNDNSSDISCHNDNYITIESDSDVSSAELSVNVSQNEKSRTGCFSVVSKKNTNYELREVNKPSKSFACENCSSGFCLPDVFTAHVMMNFNCLSYYENQKPTSSVIVPFCFKCKMNFKSACEFIDHECIGVVSIMYRCALCPTTVANLISLREHENNMHKESMEFEHVETIQTSTDNETIAAEASVYRCIPCQWTFHDSSQFVEHILQIHENNNTDVT